MTVTVSLIIGIVLLIGLAVILHNNKPVSDPISVPISVSDPISVSVREAPCSPPDNLEICVIKLRSQGVSDDRIREDLLRSSWPQERITRALEQ